MPTKWSRGKWNAAYFLGLEKAIRGRTVRTLYEQLLLGAERLSRGGHTGGQPSGRAHPSGSHDRACMELAEGTFDTVGRAGEALGWLSAHAPGVDRTWIDGLV